MCGAWLAEHAFGRLILTAYAVLMSILFLLVIIAGGVLVAAVNNLVCRRGHVPTMCR
jgi:hypothetical protein